MTVTIDWLRDLDAAKERALRERKSLLIDVMKDP